MANLNKPSTPPAKAIDAEKIRREHNRPDQRIIDRHEKILHELDSVAPEKGGHGR